MRTFCKIFNHPETQILVQCFWDVEDEKYKTGITIDAGVGIVAANACFKDEEDACDLFESLDKAAAIRWANDLLAQIKGLSPSVREDEEEDENYEDYPL